jgi:hypothetical protein
MRKLLIPLAVLVGMVGLLGCSPATPTPTPSYSYENVIFRVKAYLGDERWKIYREERWALKSLYDARIDGLWSARFHSEEKAWVVSVVYPYFGEQVTDRWHFFGIKGSESFRGLRGPAIFVDPQQ